MSKSRMSRTEKLLIIGVVLAFALLLVLMVFSVILNSAASGTLYSDPPFAISSLISDVEKDAPEVSVGTYVLPAFIGVSPSPEGMGISIGENVVRELYAMVAPCLAAGLSAEPEADTAANWVTLAGNARAVYIRYHSALPAAVLQGTAASLSGMAESGNQVMPVRELFLLLPDEQYGDCQVIVRDTSGNIWRYLCDTQGEYPTIAQAEEFVEGFASSFYRCRLVVQENGSVEPVFLERMRVRNVLMTPGTAVMMQENRVDDLKKLLQQYDFNPDKLNTHVEADGTQVVVESHGVFRTQNDRLTYTAVTDGGISLQKFIGYKERYTLFDCLQTACTIIEDLREIHPYYLGGDASLLLTEVSRTNGRPDGQLKMVFRYTFDNLILDGCSPAVVVLVEDDRVVSADLYTFALRAQGDFDSSYLEAGVLERADGTVWADVTLTYPANFANNNVYPVWTFYPEKQKEMGRR